MQKELYQEIRQEIRNRSVWEERQGVWFKMRYEGIKRVKKPYPNAPDVHYPLVDSLVEKLKPFYVAQLYDKERLSSFVSGKPQSEDVTGLAEKLFDYTLKHRTNFERSILTSIDHMLMYSRGPVKSYWDADKKKITFSAVRPIYIIVPSWTEELGDADWLVHVIHMSEAEYRRKKKFKQDDTFIKSIKGRGTSDSGGTTGQEQSILRREGITIGQDDNQIVLWEVYSRDEEGKILVDTISPMAGETDPVCAQYGLPYQHGQFPFTDIRYELADADYYAPRGLTEILHHYELDLCKLWNHKLQFLDFHGQPNFKNSGLASTPTNFENAPGRILPQGIEPVEAGAAPMDFKEEMELQRALAEDRVQVPDLSSGEHLSGKRGAKGEVTATQINALVQQSSGGNDMRARVFRLQLSQLYKQSWSLICQYVPQTEQILEDFTQVPPEAMHNQYRISPSGSGDSSSKEQRVAKALTYVQVLSGRPGMKEPELTKWVLEQDDASLVQRLYEDPADAQADQEQQQAEEIVLMKNEFPPRVKKGDDDKTHLQTMADWVGYQNKSGQPIPPHMAASLLQHSEGHAQQIQQKKDKAGMAMVKNLKPLGQYLAGIAQSGQQEPAGPGAPQAEGIAQSGQQAPDAVKESISLNYKDAPEDIKRQMEMKAGFRPSQLPPPPPAPVISALSEHLKPQKPEPIQNQP
jgi:hypothetical protein